MNSDDGQLLGELRAALATAPARPDPIELAAFDRVVAEWNRRPAPPADAPTSRFRVLEKLHHPRVVAASVVAATLALGTGVAAAAGAPVARGIRAVAHDIGLPVEAPAVVDANNAVTRLRDALARSDDTGLRAARDQLRSELRDLGGSDRASIQQHADALLQQADTRLAHGGSSAAIAPPSSAPQGSETPPGATTADTPHSPGGHDTGRAGGDFGSGPDNSRSSQPSQPSPPTPAPGGHDGHGDGAGPGPAAGSPPTAASDHQGPSADDSHGRSGRGPGDGTATTTTSAPGA